MNVGELLRERDRLLAVIEEAKQARPRIKQLNVLIAMYGDDEKVSINSKGNFIKDATSCSKCPGKTFSGTGGLKMHERRVHGNLKGNPGHPKGKANLRRVG